MLFQNICGGSTIVVCVNVVIMFSFHYNLFFFRFNCCLVIVVSHHTMLLLFGPSCSYQHGQLKYLNHLLLHFLFCTINKQYKVHTALIFVQNNIFYHQYPLRLLPCSGTRLPSNDGCHSFKFGKHNSNHSEFCSCHSPRSFHKPGGGLWGGFFFFLFFLLWPIKLLLLRVKKKNGTESKYPQTVSRGWLDCLCFGPFCQCVYCRGPTVFSQVQGWCGYLFLPAVLQ